MISKQKQKQELFVPAFPLTVILVPWDVSLWDIHLGTQVWHTCWGMGKSFFCFSLQSCRDFPSGPVEWQYSRPSQPASRSSHVSVIKHSPPRHFCCLNIISFLQLHWGTAIHRTIQGTSESSRENGIKVWAYFSAKTVWNPCIIFHKSIS